MLNRKTNKSFIKFFLMLFTISLLFLFFQPKMGIVYLLKSKIDERNLKYQLKKTQVENILLRRKIYLLKNDKNYIEKIVRENLNMIGKDEKILKRQ
ncbi:MAG: septum formation initiator family protein [candidate division WOR-3 bacterium]